MKYLVVIPARGGSKGVPRKNIKHLNGKPLICYTIDAAREVFSDEDICVSTDDLEIKTVVEKNGLKVPFLRPRNLATDYSSSQEVLVHALEFYREQGKHYDAIVLLQPTSPFRKAADIEECIKQYNSDLDMVASVKLARANPYYTLFEENADGFLIKSKKGNFTRRQDCPDVWEYNGAIYVLNYESLKTKEITEFTKVQKYEMNYWNSLDIDTEFDWLLAEYLERLKKY